MILSQYEGDIIGSIRKVEAAVHTSFESFNPAVFNDGLSFQEIQFTEESGKLRYSAKDSDQGMLYRYSGSFGIPKLRTDAEDAVHPLLGRSQVLRITDMNGRIYIIGAPDKPVDLELEGDTGQQFANPNGYVVMFGIEQTWQAFAL